MKPSHSVTVILGHDDFNDLISDALPDVVNKPYKYKAVCEGVEIADDEVTIIYHLEEADDA